MSMQESKHLPWLAAAGLAIALYAVTLGGTYIYDDHPIIRDDPRISDPSRWGEFITGSYNNGADRLYRPLTSLSYAIQWSLHGDRAWAFHLVNVLLHAGASALAAVLGTRLLGLTGGWIAGAIFAVHPVHVEAVANIVGRAELLCALGMLGSMVLLLKPMTLARSLAITGCFLLALLSKEQGMLVPPLLLALWWTRGSILRGTQSQDDRRGVLTLVMLICWLMAGYVVWREVRFGFWWERDLLDWTVNPMVVSSTNPRGGSVGADRWLMPMALLGRYAVLLVAPVWLLFDYGGTAIGWHVERTDPYLWLGFLTASISVIACVICWKQKARVALFLLVGLGASYLMVSNLITLIGVNFAERLMYVPSIFFVLLAAMGLMRLPQRMGMGLVIALVGLGATRSLIYAAAWNDPVSFYENLRRQQPGSIRLPMLLVDEHRNAGRLDQAADMARQVREQLPDYFEGWIQSGVVAMKQGKFDEAKQFFDEAWRLNHDLKVALWLQELERQRTKASSQPG